MRAISRLVIHHSASSAGNRDVIDQWHRARGFDGIGYHEIIGNGLGCPDGHIQRGRDHSRTGAGVYGANSGALHVCLIGDFTQTYPTWRQYAALGHWLLVNGERYSVLPAGIVGHREIAKPGHATACPGRLPLSFLRLWYALRQEAGTLESLEAWLSRRDVEIRA